MSKRKPFEEMRVGPESSMQKLARELEAQGKPAPEPNNLAESLNQMAASVSQKAEPTLEEEARRLLEELSRDHACEDTDCAHCLNAIKSAFVREREKR